MGVKRNINIFGSFVEPFNFHHAHGTVVSFFILTGIFSLG